ncbi:MAG TPA: metal-dependent hydrolase [Gemmatimonadaceae bacterium]|nr:metal-dependent hydrolase [Gemmatimonadaceae bacterium]
MTAFADIRWLGHATFEITSRRGTRFLIDPFIKGNPSTPAALKSLGRYAGADQPIAILVSHSHGDHSADTVEVATLSRAPVYGEYEFIASLPLPEGQGIGGNVGGTFTIGETTVHFVTAIHSSSPGGRPIGFVIDFGDGNVVYDTADTWIFGDMALIHEIFRPTVILLNTGGGPYTQDPKTAALAVKKYFAPRAIVPMHWGTFPVLATEADVRAAFAGDDRLALMKPGESRAF